MRTSRPSASVLITSTVFPLMLVKTSPGFVAPPPGRFSVHGATPSTFTSGFRRPMAASAAMTLAAPVMSAFMHHMKADMTGAASVIAALDVDTAAQVKGAGTVDFLMRLIPTTFVGAFSSGDVLQVLLLSVAFGCALSLIGDAGA